MVNTELYHHGIKGQKWGRRRYQNKDGTLTPAGKKRYENEYTRLRDEKKVLTNQKKTNAKIKKLEDMQKANDDLRREVEGGSTAKKGGKTESAPEKPKGISDLSTEELRARTDRMRAERDYITAQMELSRLQPERKTAGRKFAEKVLKEQIVPAAVDVGKKQAEKYLKKKLGLDDSTADALKKESERLKREADDWTNKKRADQAKEYFREKEKAKSSSGTKDDEPETFKTTGKDVFGEGTSRYEKKQGPVYDADFTEFTSGSYTNTGKSYVQLLLEDKQMRHSDESLFFENELYHYGVKGMKWGVHRKGVTFRTTDTVGKSYTKRQKKRIKKQAESILKNKIREQDSTARLYSKAADKQYNKADKQVWKSEDKQNRGDNAGFTKHQGKAWKHLAKQYEYSKVAENAIEKSNILKKKLADIQSDTIEAGKDYVTNASLTQYWLRPYNSFEQHIDFKN